jgi:hypothetical protein
MIVHCPVLVHVAGLVSGCGHKSLILVKLRGHINAFQQKIFFFSFKTFMLTH